MVYKSTTTVRTVVVHHFSALLYSLHLFGATAGQTRVSALPDILPRQSHRTLRYV